LNFLAFEEVDVTIKDFPGADKSKEDDKALCAVEDNIGIPGQAGLVCDSHKPYRPCWSGCDKHCYPHPQQNGMLDPSLFLGLSASIVPSRLAQEDSGHHKESDVYQEGDDYWDQETEDEGEEVVDPTTPHTPITGHPVLD
jgi:hypothetical protein